MATCVAPDKSDGCSRTSVALGCNHQLCDKHLRELIRGQVRASKTSIKCPACSKNIDDAVVIKWIDERDEANFIYLCLREIGMHNTSLNYVECTRCNHLQFHLGSAATPIVFCERCKTPYCFKHKIIWADGHNCETFGKDFKLDLSNRACPKCGTFLHRISGCNYFVCPKVQCKHVFCFVCLADWRSPHGDHWLCPTPPKGYDRKGNIVPV